MLKLEPHSEHYIWGRGRLKDYGKNAKAESWESSVIRGKESKIDSRPFGQTLLQYSMGNPPPLVKILDCGSKLSVQVHPLKDELWYVVQADAGATALCGAKSLGGIARDPMGEMTRVPLIQGEAVFVPRGCPHAIMGGCILLEVQDQNAVTYRYHDWDRGRELQLPHALSATDLDARYVQIKGDIKFGAPGFSFYIDKEGRELPKGAVFCIVGGEGKCGGKVLKELAFYIAEGGEVVSLKDGSAVAVAV